MISRLLLIVLISFNAFILKASTIDSLLVLLSVERNDTADLQVYDDLGNATYLESIDTALYYWSKGLALSEKIIAQYPNITRFRLMNADFCNSIGYAYKLLGDREKGIAHYKIGLKKYYQLYGEVDSTVINNRIGTSYNNIGSNYFSMGDIPQAIESYHQALLIRELSKDTLGIVRSHINLGNLNYSQKEWKNAEKHYKTAMVLASSIDDVRGLGLSLNGLGAIHQNNGSYELAIEMFLQNLELRKKANDLRGIATAYNNLGFIYGKLNRTKEGIEAFTQSYEVAHSVGDMNGEIYALKNLGSIHYTIGNIDKSLEILKKSNDLAQQTQDPAVIRDLSEQLAEVYEAKGDFKNAYHYFKLFKNTSDSLINQENIKALTQKEMQFQFDSEKRAQELIQRQKDFEKDQELALSQLYFKIGIGISIILVLFLTYGIVVYKQKVKLNDAISAQNHEIQMKNDQIEKQHQELVIKNKEVTDSIKYARRLQKGFLHSTDQVQISNAFIFFAPKDIVSGDFFWIQEVDDELLFAVIDCTGHGVPGAFLSLLGKQSLDKIILTKNITNPGVILDELNKEVEQYFKNNVIAGEAYYDGMDASFCKLNKKSKTLEFAGAKSNMYLLNEDGMVKVKGNNRGIGKGYGSNVPFENHELEVHEGDMIYLASDGYQDQFGGQDGKKFKLKRFYDLLNDTKSLDVTEQKQLFVSTFNSWKADLEQVDDVTVIGVKVSS